MTRCTSPSCTATIEGAPLPGSRWRVTANGIICPKHARELDELDGIDQRDPEPPDETVLVDPEDEPTHVGGDPRLGGRS